MTEERTVRGLENGFFMKIISLFLSIFLYLQYSFADCSKPVTYLAEGAKAPCTGYLFTPDTELKVRTEMDKFEKTKELLSAQKTYTAEISKELLIKAELNNNLKEQVKNLEEQSVYTKALWFGLGIILGGYTVYQIRK